MSTTVGVELCQMCDWDLCVLVCKCSRFSIATLSDIPARNGFEPANCLRFD